MKFLVELTARATSDLEDLFLSLDVENSIRARQWFDGLERKIESLAVVPTRGTPPIKAPGLRQVFYGRRPNVYRIIYAVAAETGLVRIVHIRHGSRDAVSRGGLA